MFSVNRNGVDPNNPWKYAKNWDSWRTGLKHGITNYVWSPIQWKNGIRKEGHFIQAKFCVLDFDGELSLDSAVNDVFVDCSYLIGTTKSHGINKGGHVADRFRVIIPFAEVITDIFSYKATMRKYVNLFGSDEACVDGARYFFPCKKILHEQILSPSDNLEIVKVDKPEQRRPYNHFGRKLPSWIMEILKHSDPQIFAANGSRNDLVFRVSAGLAGCGIANESLIFNYISNSKIPSACVDRKTGRTKNKMPDKEIISAIKSGIKRGLAEYRETRS